MSTFRSTVRTPAGDRSVLDHRLRRSSAWDAELPTSTFDVAVRTQRTVDPTTVRLSLRPPDGWTITGLPDGARRIGDTVVWRGEPGLDEVFSYDLARTR